MTVISLSQHCFAEQLSETEKSQLSKFQYPSHSCGTKIKHPKIVKQRKNDEMNEQYYRDVAKYNIEVVKYNKEIKSYKSCINQFIKKGNADINVIRRSLVKALNEARAK